MNYQLQQTGDQVQEILNQAPTTEQNLQSEITRSTTKDEQLETAIGNEKTRAEGVESNLQTAIGNEVTRAEGAESNLQTAIANEKTRAELIEGGLRTDVDAIKAEIPTQASPENQLADKAFVNSSIATNTAEFKGTYNSLEDLQTQVQDANANDYAFVVSTDAAGNTVYNRYKYVEGTGWVFEYALNNSSFTSAQWAAIQSGITAALVAKLVGLPTATELATQMNQIIASVTAETTRAEGIESGLRTDVNANAAAIVAEKNRAEGVEGTLSTAIGTEKSRAEGAETILQQNIDAEALARGNADTTLQGEIDAINGKIPSQATASNQLADKAFVNSSIATNTADFKGTYNSLQELEAVTANNNDYGFVVSTDAAGNTVYNRYKYVEGTGWVFEYALNNSSFTSAQWAAIQSGITAALVTKLTNLPDNTALTAMFTAITSLIPSAASSDNKLVDYAQLVASLATKQDTLTFDDAPTQSSTNPVKSGGVYTAIATVTTALNLLDQSKQDKLTFDTYPTAGSDNPVKSKGIYEKLSEKQNTLTFDNTPTTGSDNPVKSQGIKSYVDAETTRAQNAESALSGRVTTAEGNITSLTGRMTTAEGNISTNAADIANLQQLYNNLQESKPVPVTALPETGQQQGVIYRLAGTTSYSDYMWNGSTWVLMATYDNAIDDVPTFNSNNLVKSGGVFSAIAKTDSKILYTPEYTVVQFGLYYNQLYNIELQAGHKYYVKHVSGMYTNIFVDTGGTDAMGVDDKWREFIPAVTGNPRAALGTSDPGSNYQIVMIADSEGVIGELFKLDSKIDKNIIITPAYSIVQLGSYYNQLYDIELVAGHKYYVKHVSGMFSNLFVDTAASDLIAVDNTWREFVPAVTGNPRSALGTSDPGGNYQVIAIADSESQIAKQMILTEYPVYLSPNGNDSNSGTTPDSPKLSIQAAIDAGYRNIVLAAGEYKGQKVYVSGVNGLSIICNSSENEPNIFENHNRRKHAKIDNSIDVELSAYSGNVYRSPLTVDNQHTYYKVFISQELPIIYSSESYYGRVPTYNAILWEKAGYVANCKKLVPVLTLSECENTEGTFTYDGTYVYVHPFGNTITNKTYKRLYYDTDTENLVVIHNSSNIYIQGVDILFAPNYDLHTNIVTKATVKDCIFGFTSYGSAAMLVNSDMAFYSCISARAAADGYGIAGVGDCSFFGCDGLYCDDDGISHHEYSTGIIDGGTWSGNLKGGVTPSYGADVKVQNIVCTYNVYGVMYVTDTINATNKPSILQDALCYGNNTADISITKYSVISHGCAYRTKETLDGGYFEEYGNSIIS